MTKAKFDQRKQRVKTQYKARWFSDVRNALH